MDDLLIVGGGPVGATLALALRDSGLTYRVLDARRSGVLGGGDRTLALAHNARLTFERIGVWEDLASATPIETIDISQKGGLGVTQLTAREAGVPALGYVVRYGELQAALDAALARAGITVLFDRKVESIHTTPGEATVVARNGKTEVAEAAEEHAARLVVVADGSGEALPGIYRRKIDYRQHALIGLVTSKAMRPGVAFERFTTDGPVALLPFESGYAMVWSATPGRAAALLAMDDTAFLGALHAHFGDRVGQFTSIAQRKSFPLSLQFATHVTGERTVVLGNAAQALHPVAGQGFNLGLRDVCALAQLLLDTQREDIGSARQLAAYAKTRRADRWAGVAVTHGLVNTFASDHPLLAGGRGLGLTLLDSVPLLKRAFARTMLNGIR
jgi:2-octaprenyl-6-methoxyphenol hydroxylase